MFRSYSIPLAWRERPLNKLEKGQRADLFKALRIAWKFEHVARPRKVRLRGQNIVQLVAYAHLVRSIQLCKGILDLRENPVEYVLLRTLFEIFINVLFILSDQSQAIIRSKNFYDFSKVSRLRFLLEIVRRFPHIPQKDQEKNLIRKLEKYKHRFRHSRSGWNWDKLDLVSRVENIGKTMKSSKEGEKKFSRYVALYQETNSYVHSDMRSLGESIDRGGRGEAVRPKLRARHAEIGVPFIAATLLAQVMEATSKCLGIHAYDNDIRSLGNDFQRFLDQQQKK